MNLGYLITRRVRPSHGKKTPFKLVVVLSDVVVVESDVVDIVDVVVGIENVIFLFCDGAGVVSDQPRPRRCRLLRFYRAIILEVGSGEVGRNQVGSGGFGWVRTGLEGGCLYVRTT